MTPYHVSRRTWCRPRMPRWAPPDKRDSGRGTQNVGPDERRRHPWANWEGCKQELQRRRQRPPKHQSLRRLRASEFAESSGSLPSTGRSSTCAARCPSATASGVVGTSIRDRIVPIGHRRPTTTQGSGRTEDTSLGTTSGWRICCNQRDHGWRMKINAMLGSGCRWRRSPHI